MTVCAYPRLSKTDLLFTRIGGDGLGNLLFNWARCLSVADKNGWQMVWPTWRSHKPKNKRVNPYDHRLYDDLFRPTERYIHGWRKPLALTTRRWVSEAQAAASAPSGRVVVQFRGMQGKFEPFLEHRDLVREQLLAMTRPRHLAGYAPAQTPSINIHVRLGDFQRAGSASQVSGADNMALPLDWYINTLQAVRKHLGKNYPVQVFSDGTEQELAPLLALEGVQRREYGSAIADMLALSCGRLLIASGSTFSMWASYLHQVPTVWFPGKWLQRLHQSQGTEWEWTPGDPMPPWLTPAWMESNVPQS